MSVRARESASRCCRISPTVFASVVVSCTRDMRKIIILNYDFVHGGCDGWCNAAGACSRMADAADWAVCAPPCTRTATHRILAPHAERMLRSPPCARLTSRILANARHREAEPTASALEGSRSVKSASGEDTRAKLAAERVHRQLTVGLVLPVPASHRNLGARPQATWHSERHNNNKLRATRVVTPRSKLGLT